MGIISLKNDIRDCYSARLDQGDVDGIVDEYMHLLSLIRFVHCINETKDYKKAYIRVYLDEALLGILYYASGKVKGSIGFRLDKTPLFSAVCKAATSIFINNMITCDKHRKAIIDTLSGYIAYEIRHNTCIETEELARNGIKGLNDMSDDELLKTLQMYKLSIEDCINN